MLQNAVKSALANDFTKESDAAAAARKAYLAGASIGGPAGIVLGPVLGAAAFMAVMAFAGGGVVPGVGMGDTVPAMLTPGEGVVPGGVMDGLSKMARSGTMGGGPTNNVHVAPVYHLNAIDSEGMDKVLQNHNDTIQKHVSNELRKLNR